jgi:tight adherence protein B
MSETWVKAIVLISVFGSVVLLAEALLSWAARSRTVTKTINARLDMIAQGRSRAEMMSLLRRSDEDLVAKVPPALAPMAMKFERLMTAAQVRMPASRILLLLAVAPVVLFVFIVFVMFASTAAIGVGNVLMIATFSVAAGLGLPLLFLQVRANRTRKRMTEQFPIALDVFVRGLRAGHPIAAALDLLTVELPDPIGSEFGLVVDEVTYGADLRDALQAMAERWDSDDMRMFVVSLSVQTETGGNLAEILDNLAQVIRERASMMMKVRALSSEGRMTAVMLTVLPILAFTSLFMLNPRFYLQVSDDPAFMPGFVGLLVLYAIGFITIRRMVDLKV